MGWATPGGADDQVAGAEAQDPVAEQVAALLLHDHAGGVVDGLAAADLQALRTWPGVKIMYVCRSKRRS